MPGLKKRKSIVKKAKEIQKENFRTGRRRRKEAFDRGAENIDTIFDPTRAGRGAF